MIQIFVNGESLEFTVEHEKTIGELLGEVETFCNKNGHTVFKIIADGKEIPAEQLDAFFAKPISGKETLQLFTQSGDEVTAHIRELGSVFKESAAALQNVSVKMQTGDDAAVLILIESVSQQMKTLLDFLRLEIISNIGVNTKLGDSSILEEQKKITGFLKEIADAFADNDIITVSDLCEYELAPLLENLGAGLAEL